MTEQNNNENEDKKRTMTEEVEVAGSQLVERIQEIVRQGNVRRLVIRSADDRVLLETSLTVGAVAGGAIALMPGGVPLAVLAVIAAAVARVRIEIIREVEDGDIVEDRSDKKKVEIAVDEDGDKA